MSSNKPSRKKLWGLPWRDSRDEEDVATLMTLMAGRLDSDQRDSQITKIGIPDFRDKLLARKFTPEDMETMERALLLYGHEMTEEEREEDQADSDWMATFSDELSVNN